MSTFAAQWNPEEVLEIGQVSSRFTCIGNAHSQGQRYHLLIPRVNRQQAIDLLREMSMMDVSSPAVEESLKLLARLLLCTHHQDQVLSVVRKWHNQIAGVHIQEIAEPDIAAEWERVTRSSSVAVHQWTARLEQSLLHGGAADIHKTVKLLSLAIKRERDCQCQVQLAELKTSNEDLHREVESLRTQLAYSANDPVHGIATPVTSPARARQPSADSSAPFTHQISAGANHRSPHGHSHHHIHQIRIHLDLRSESVSASQHPYPQTVSQPEPSFHSPLLIP